MNNPEATYAQLIDWHNHLRRQTAERRHPTARLYQQIHEKARTDTTTEDILRTYSIIEQTGVGWWHQSHTPGESGMRLT